MLYRYWLQNTMLDSAVSADNDIFQYETLIG